MGFVRDVVTTSFLRPWHKCKQQAQNTILNFQSLDQHSQNISSKTQRHTVPLWQFPLPDAVHRWYATLMPTATVFRFWDALLFQSTNPKTQSLAGMPGMPLPGTETLTGDGARSLGFIVLYIVYYIFMLLWSWADYDDLYQTHRKTLNLHS